MKQTLQLRIGQQLTMTPQLQQAIRLLQLSSLDLSAEVQELVEGNPMLELAEGDDAEEADKSASSSSDQDAAEMDTHLARETDTLTEAETSVAATESEVVDAVGQSEIPDELPVDSNWEDIYEVPVAPTASASSHDQNDFPLDIQGNGTSESLQDHLLWQMRLNRFSDTDELIGETIIDTISDDGYLTTSLENIWESIKNDATEAIEFDEIQMVLHRIQGYDPVGVGARDLRECLLLQLTQFADDDSTVKRALHLVSEYLPLLGSRDFTQLLRRMKLEKTELQKVIELIQSLNPRPGNLIASSQAEYVVPDVLVKKIKDAWRVELNPDVMPRLRINSGYANLVKRADNSPDNTYLKNNLQEARWFIKSLQSRNETLLKVATCIVERQKKFLDFGDEAMNPLVLHDIAEAVGMHESTISRVTTQKYMHTPLGIFELKYFFSSHVSTAGGGVCSATAIRALIKKLIAVENVQKPLSDSKIAAALAEQGINVARRTVAKYREAMSVPSSNERKRLA